MRPLIRRLGHDDRVLTGSGDHYGELRKVGEHVVRPVGPRSAAVHALLRHLEVEGFDGAPRLVHTSDAEEVLTFIEGDVPVPPEPPADGWVVVSDERAASVGSLLRRFHTAARTFDDHVVMCHNDPAVGNVVFRGEQAVALIDFDFAGPNDPVRDLAIAAQHWVPLADPTDFVDAPADWEPCDRLAAMAGAYRLPTAELERLLDMVEGYLERGRRGVRARVDAGQERFVAYWEAGLGDRLLRAHAWVRHERRVLVR